MAIRPINHAVVTGASSGLGEEFARLLATRGVDELVVIARRRERLEELAGELSGRHGCSVDVHVADLTDPEDLGEVERRLRDEQAPTDLLVNNAGFGAYGAFHELDAERQAAMVQLNVTAVVRLTHAALSVLVPRGRGGVINVSSLAGFLPVPYGTTYGATKAFVLSFTEALAEELEATGVGMMALAPGPTPTGFQETTGFHRQGWARSGMLGPAAVVREGLRDYLRGRTVCVPGLRYRLAAWGAELAPSAITRRIAKAVTEEMTGRR